MLGTFITEGRLGAQRCRRLLGSSEAARATARQLVAVARQYGFEGWLVNIENGLSRQGVACMLEFLAALRAGLEAEVPHGILVW